MTPFSISDIKLYKPLWFLLHALAIGFVFWLGHFVKF